MKQTERGRIHLNTELLKDLRQERCWSQESLANRCFDKGLRVSLSSVKRAETGKKVLYRTALDLARIYQVPVNELKMVNFQLSGFSRGTYS